MIHLYKVIMCFRRFCWTLTSRDFHDLSSTTIRYSRSEYWKLGSACDNNRPGNQDRQMQGMPHCHSAFRTMNLPPFFASWWQKCYPKNNPKKNIGMAQICTFRTSRASGTKDGAWEPCWSDIQPKTPRSLLLPRNTITSLDAMGIGKKINISIHNQSMYIHTYALLRLCFNPICLYVTI